MSGVFGTRLGEQIAAEQGGRLLLEQVAAVPSVGQVGGVDPAHGVVAEGELLAVAEAARLAVGDVVDGHHLGHRTTERYGAGCHGQELVEGAAFVGLEVRDAEIAQAADRDHGLDGLADQRKHPARPGVEQERFVVDDQKLVEGETHRQRRRRAAPEC